MQQKIQDAVDIGSVAVIGVSWLPIVPAVVSVIASLVAIAWIGQRWYWAAKDRKKNDS